MKTEQLLKVYENRQKRIYGQKYLFSNTFGFKMAEDLSYKQVLLEGVKQVLQVPNGEYVFLGLANTPHYDKDVIALYKMNDKINFKIYDDYMQQVYEGILKEVA